MIELILNLAFIGAGLLADIKLYNTTDIYLPALHRTAPVMFREESYSLFTLGVPPNEDGKCKYTGLVVGFDRDWAESIQPPDGSPETVLPPEPGKLAGHAIIINKKTCPGEAPQAMFRVSTRELTLMRKGEMLKAFPIWSRQLSSLPETHRPKWLTQVMCNVAKAAETDVAAKEFLSFTKEAEQAALNTKGK